MSEAPPTPETTSPADELRGSGPMCCGLSWVPDLPWREMVLLVYVTFALAMVYYHSRFPFLPHDWQIFGWFGLNFVLLLLVPLALIVFVFKQPLRDYGFTLGDTKVWGRDLLILLAIMLPIAAFASRLPQFHGYYPRFRPMLEDHWLVIPSSLGWLVYFAGWEFVFRGFMLFGLKKRCGVLAIFIQMVPFAMAHFPKLEPEALASIVAGLALGVMAWRSKSFVGPWLLHWLIATSMDWFVIFWPLSR